jgi:5-methylcytosine-specific restriction enzyme subunit McrC
VIGLASAQDTPAVARTSDGVPIGNLWYMLLYAWREERFLQKWRAEVESAPSLEALLAAILSSLLQQQLRVGLGRGYVGTTAEIRGIRGRVDFPRSLTRLSFENGRATCRFDELKTNVLRNRVIRSTLARLVQRGSFGPNRSRAETLRHELRGRVRELEGVDLIPLNLQTIKLARAGHADGGYGMMLAICELLYVCWMPREQAGGSLTPRLDRANLVLHIVYERFVANFFKVHLRGWSVRAQGRLSWREELSSQYLPGMSPDLILQNRTSGELVVLDTKYTDSSLARGRFEKDRFKASHLYQIYAYLRSQEGVSAAHDAASGLLLYPTVGIALAEEVRLQGHSVRFLTLDLDQQWAKLEKALLEVIP